MNERLQIIRDNHLEEKLQKIKVQALSESEGQWLWQEVWQNKDRTPANAGWSVFSLLLTKKYMILALALMLVLGGSVATVQAADSAKPGDWLFPLDQAVEKVQLSFSSEGRKEELKVKIAAERTEELQKIIVEAKTNKSDQDSAVRDEKIKTSLNLVAEIRDELSVSANSRTEVQMDNIVKLIEEELSTFEGPVKWQAKFKGQGGLKFKVEAEEEEDGEIKVSFESKGFRFFTGTSTSTGTSSGTSTATSTPGRSDNEKIRVCHVASSRNKHELKISRSALAAHLAHGDSIGDCPDDDDEDNATTTSTSTPVSLDPIRINDEINIKIKGGSDAKDDDKDKDDRGRDKDDDDDD